MIALGLFLLAAAHMRDQTTLAYGLLCRLACIGRIRAQMLLLVCCIIRLRHPCIQCRFQQFDIMRVGSAGDE